MLAGKFGPQDMRTWSSATQQLTSPTVVHVYAMATSAPVLLYTNRQRTAGVSNSPVPIGVAKNVAGVDTVGNLIFFAEVGEYDVVADGDRFTVTADPVPKDLTDAIAAAAASQATSILSF